MTCDECLDTVKEKLSNILNNQRYPFSDICSHISGSEGKLLRSRLGIFCGCDENGKIDGSVADSLCAIELLHLATLIHDDIIDNSPIRRGKESVQQKFGKSAAIVTGDYIFTLCYSLIAKSDPELLPLMSRAVSFICRGEMRQNRNRYNGNLTALEYYRIIGGKTAALFALSALAGNNANRKNELAKRRFRIGYFTGMAFQIEDDIKDFTNGHNDKPTMSDYSQGVITLPVILGNGNVQKGIVLSQNAATRYKNKVIQYLGEFNEYSSAGLNKIINSI